MLGDQIKREMHQSIVEVGTKICADVNELREEIVRNRRELASAAERVGLRRRGCRHASLLALEGSDHLARRPLRQHRRGAAAARAVAPDLRPARARRPCRIGTAMIDLMNEVRYFLPHLLALSTSSPFWMGRDTGLKSYRTTIFRRFPRTGVPDHFESWSEYENYIQLLVELHCIDDAQEDLVGRAAASDVRHARVPRLRRADASRGGGDARRARAGDRRQAVSAARDEPRASGSTGARSSKRTSGAPRAAGSTAS